jgi:hypothetical protein
LYQTLLSDSRLFQFLLRIDRYLAADAKAGGCRCGGKLHGARYPRKPRGIPSKLDDDSYRMRDSFCCATEGCRRRTTPASFRFLGRRVFVSAAVVLVSVLRDGPTPTRMAALRKLVEVSPRTVGRWRSWWRETFVQTPFWRAVRGFFRVPVDESALPLSLLEAFPANSAKRKLLRLLRLIGPLTTSSLLQDICGSMLSRRRCGSTRGLRGA